MFKKSNLLSTVATATLIGSIMALGFMAAPAHAADTAPTFVFRLHAKLLTPPVVVADNGDAGGTGETGGETDAGGTGSESGSSDGTEAGSEAAPWPHMVITLSNGMIMECRSNDVFKAAYGYTPEIITQMLDGASLTMVSATVARGKLFDYQDKKLPMNNYDWSFSARAVHAPRSGCDYPRSTRSDRRPVDQHGFFVSGLATPLHGPDRRNA